MSSEISKILLNSLISKACNSICGFDSNCSIRINSANALFRYFMRKISKTFCSSSVTLNLTNSSAFGSGTCNSFFVVLQKKGCILSFIIFISVGNGFLKKEISNPKKFLYSSLYKICKRL